MTISGSSAGQRERIRVERTRLVLVEGFADQALCMALASHMSIVDLHVHVIATNTAAAFRTELSVLLDDDYFQLAGTTVALMSDADSQADATFQRMQDVLQKTNLPIPSRAATWATGDRWKTGVFITPGLGRNGTLEDLLLAQAQPQRLACGDAFLADLAGRGLPTPVHPSKTRFQVYLAGLPKVTQSATVHIRKGGIDLDHQGLEPLRSFLSTLV